MSETRKLKVFLCHTSQDKPFVRELYQRLISEGWIEPWLDEEKLLPGQDWDMEIQKATKITDTVIVCLSTNSVDKEGYVQHEIRLVLRVADYKPEDTIFIIPIRLNNCTVPIRLELQHYVDFFPPERKDWAYQRLIKSLRTRYEQISRNELKEVEEKSVSKKEKWSNLPRPQKGKKTTKKVTLIGGKTIIPFQDKKTFRNQKKLTNSFF
ncbi:MAG: toll/interleukin-1 receptor domain-containing protein [Anaerolineales bacterium]